MYLSLLLTSIVGPACCHLSPGGTEPLLGDSVVATELDGHLVAAAGHRAGEA